MAARALGDLALLYGPGALDAHLDTAAAADENGAEAAAAAPLEQAGAYTRPLFGST